MPRIAAIPLLFVAALMALTACGGSSVPHKNGIADPCVLVTTAEVTKELHLPITTAKKRHEKFPNGVRECAWVMKASAKVSTALIITVVRSNKATDKTKRSPTVSEAFQLDQNSPGSRPIARLGDNGLTIGDTVEFLKGDTLVMFRYETNTRGPTTLDRLRGQALVNLATKASTRL
jgi:hypothetical protein